MRLTATRFETISIIWTVMSLLMVLLYSVGVYVMVQLLQEQEPAFFNPTLFISISLGYVFTTLVNVYLFYLSKFYLQRDHERALTVSSALCGIATAALLIHYVLIQPRAPLATAMAVMFVLHAVVFVNQRNYFRTKRRQSMPVDIDPSIIDRFNRA